MRTRKQWVGIIVMLAALLFASAGVGQARESGRRGVAGMGSAATGSTMASTNLEVSIGLAAHASVSASGRSGGRTGEPIPTHMRIRQGLWLPLPYMPHPYHSRREDKPLELGPYLVQALPTCGMSIWLSGRKGYDCLGCDRYAAVERLVISHQVSHWFCRKFLARAS
jgi:hypothetical protein